MGGGAVDILGAIADGCDRGDQLRGFGAAGQGADMRPLGRQVHLGVQHAGGCALEMRISQGDLADLLSVGRQAVNAELSQLQADGLVRVSRSHIDVLDLDALRARIPKGLEAPTQGGHVHTPLGLC